MKINLKRWYTPLATYGNGEVIADDGAVIFKFHTLELPWKDNKKGISCIPEGTYDAHKEGPTDKRPYIYFRVPNVPGRFGILWHPGNYTRQIRGCTLPGYKILDLDKDGILDITETTKTLKTLVDLMPPKFQLVISKGG